MGIDVNELQNELKFQQTFVRLPNSHRLLKRDLRPICFLVLVDLPLYQQAHSKFTTQNVQY